MPKYEKPNGKVLNINPESVEYAESLGWKPYKAPKKTVKKTTKKAVVDE